MQIDTFQGPVILRTSTLITIFITTIDIIFDRLDYPAIYNTKITSANTFPLHLHGFGIKDPNFDLMQCIIAD